jgi:prepilin-type N-terminal cleavage/methylation domain-containing protein
MGDLLAKASMPTLATGLSTDALMSHRAASRAAGFTLLELLVVMVIIAITALIGVSLVPPLRSEGNTGADVLELVRRARVASDLASLSGRDFGLVLARERYALVERHDDGRWLPPAETELTGDARLLGVLGLTVEGEERMIHATLADALGEGPVLTTDALGDWPIFVIVLARTAASDGRRVHVRSTASGRIEGVVQAVPAS